MFLNRAKRLSYIFLYDLYGLNLTTKLTKKAQSLTKNVAIEY
jgi:hypothetical protein